MGAAEKGPRLIGFDAIGAGLRRMGAAALRVTFTAGEMQRNVGLIAHDPAIVARRSRRNIEQRPGPQFVNRAILHSGRGTPRKHHSDMLDVTPRRAHTRPNVYGPFPSRQVGGAPNGQAT